MAKYLVTSALPYANGPIHFGHVAGAYLPADVYVRYLRMSGHDVLYVCGTDEYGVAITLKAEQEGLEYGPYLDRWHQEIKALFDQFKIEFDIFSGTARCPYHQETAQTFFKNLLDCGLVNDRVERQWYSEESGRFLPDRYLTGTCPECGHTEARGDECPSCGTWIDASALGNPTSLIDGSKPVLKETRHWYLDLPRIQAEGLGGWYANEDENHPHKKWKPNVDGHVQAMLKDLRERPITRDLPWGVPLPEGVTDESGKVLYVWFDAPIGYISITKQDIKDWKKWWHTPKDVRLVQFMGKDNIPFHTILFPSSLMGAEDDYVLLDHISSNEYLNYEGGQFSKSRHVGIFGDDAKNTGIKADIWRYCIMVNRPEKADTEFSWLDFQSKINHELVANLGNLVNRTMKFLNSFYGGIIPKGSFGKIEREFIKEVKEKSKLAVNLLDEVKIKDSLRGIMNISKLGNTD